MWYQKILIGRIRIPGQPEREIWTTESRSAVRDALAGKRREPIEAQATMARSNGPLILKMEVDWRDEDAQTIG
jgi:hypothetical protein